MWSVSKVATAIALLEVAGWDAKPGPLRSDVKYAMRAALVGSTDCAQRQMVVELQEATGGPAAAQAAVQSVLDRAGARQAVVLDRAAEASSGCQPYLSANSQTPDPYRLALQLGTAEWTVQDAARFALALGNGTFGSAIQRRILSLLRRPKEHSEDPFAQGLDVTTRLDWGAGEALGDLMPAYKAGWGGSSGETPTFVNEQVIFLDLPTGPLGIALTYEPATVPIRDDPGLTEARGAMKLALTQLRAQLGL
jgi:hypothetical protein